LAVAAVQGNLAATRMLLKFDANVNHADEYGFTSLHFTASRGYLQIAHSLVTHNADI
jgi:ankyrin repeat protein